MLERGGEARKRDANFLRGAGLRWTGLASVRLFVCSGGTPQKSGVSRKSGFRFRRTVQQNDAFWQTRWSMKRYCSLYFQRPLYEHVKHILSRPVKVLRVSEGCATLRFIPVSQKRLCFLHTMCERIKSIFGVPQAHPRGPPGGSKTSEFSKSSTFTMRLQSSPTDPKYSPLRPENTFFAGKVRFLAPVHTDPTRFPSQNAFGRVFKTAKGRPKRLPEAIQRP